MVSQVIFDTNGSGLFGDSVQGNADVGVVSNRSGEFGRDAVGRQSPTTPPAEASFIGQLSGASALTGFVYTKIGAPLRAAIYSPVTSLFGTTDERVLATNMGLDLTGLELGNFDGFAALARPDIATQVRGRQVTALNLKLLAQAGLETTGNPTATGAIEVKPNLDAVRAQLLAGPVNFNAPDSVLQILNRSRRAAFTNDAGRRTAAQLLARFGEAVDRHLTTAARIADIEYGLRLLVLPELDILFNTSAPTAAQISRISAITSDDLVAGFLEFGSIQPIAVASATFAPVVDYFKIVAISQTMLASQCATGTDSPTCNDIDLTVGGPLNVQAVQLTAVRVPAQFASYLSVTQAADGTLTLRRLASGRRLIWFDYDARDRQGISGTSRAYVLMADE
ncbi:hypothetical protein A7X12_08160 [Sphingomonas sp. TDK1]|nr:hypothetical protein A7X12_08160 [Sphingomonas sp. TDK1]